jgi:hypothetical protein
MQFITGNSFKNMAHYILDEFGFRFNRQLDTTTPIYFVKTDYVNQFFNSSMLPKKSFNLITHNSDYSIDKNHYKYIEYKFLNKWFAQNVNYKHLKLIPIPIGIANEEWPHGDISVLQKIIDKNYSKERIGYANFNTQTNPKQRKYCLKYIPNYFIENNVDFSTYLKHTAKSYFSICPLGNGIDSHRIWESLYLMTIPIAERTLNASYLATRYNLPILFIDDWSEIHNLNLNKDLYKSIIKSFNTQILFNIVEFLS